MRDGLTALGRLAVQLGHHLAQDPAPPMGRQHADQRDPGGPDLAARRGHPERERARDADGEVALEGADDAVHLDHLGLVLELALRPDLPERGHRGHEELAEGLARGRAQRDGRRRPVGHPRMVPRRRRRGPVAERRWPGRRDPPELSPARRRSRAGRGRGSRPPRPARSSGRGRGGPGWR